MVSPTFKQLQAVKTYYQFSDALDVDRYKIDGALTDTVIAVRAGPGRAAGLFESLMR